MARVNDLAVTIKAESLNYREHIPKIAADDARVVVEKDIQYGASWCRRGGVGAYMVMIRKVDRMEQRVEQMGYDIFKAIHEDNRAEGVIDDIRDLRGYLLLIEAYLIENHMVAPRYTTTAPLPESRCYARFNGFVCQKEAGHNGDHSSGISATDVAWPRHWKEAPPEQPHSGDAHGRDTTRIDSSLNDFETRHGRSPI